MKVLIVNGKTLMNSNHMLLVTANTCNWLVRSIVYRLTTMSWNTAIQQVHYHDCKTSKKMHNQFVQDLKQLCRKNKRKNKFKNATQLQRR